jgi:hypothetical protein
MNALAGNFDNAEWVEIWNADFDTNVLDTSAGGDQSSETREALGICHDFDTETIVPGKQSNMLPNTLKF